MTTKTRTITEAEIELSEPHRASYEKEDFELLLKLLQRLSREIDATQLPQDWNSRKVVIGLWRAQLTGYRNILASMLDKRGMGDAGTAQNRSAYGKRGDDPPVCTMPYIDKVKLPDKPTMRLPGPKRGPK